MCRLGLKTDTSLNSRKLSLAEHLGGVGSIAKVKPIRNGEVCHLSEAYTLLPVLQHNKHLTLSPKTRYFSSDLYSMYR